MEAKNIFSDTTESKAKTKKNITCKPATKDDSEIYK